MATIVIDNDGLSWMFESRLNNVKSLLLWKSTCSIYVKNSRRAVLSWCRRRVSARTTSRCVIHRWYETESRHSDGLKMMITYVITLYDDYCRLCGAPPRLGSSWATTQWGVFTRSFRLFFTIISMMMTDLHTTHRRQKYVRCIFSLMSCCSCDLEMPKDTSGEGFRAFVQFEVRARTEACIGTG